MKTRQLPCLALLLASVSTTGIVSAQPQPQQPPPDAALPAQPAPPQPPPAEAPPGWVPGAPAGAAPQAPAPQWPQFQGASAGPVVVMPPGYLEQPGQWPRRLPIQEKGDPAPLGYHISKEPRRALWASGTAIFVAGHAITGVVAGGMLSAGGEEHDALLYIPILGPIIWAPVEQPLDTSDGRGLFAAMSLVTAGQGVGFALMVAGFVFKQPVFYRNDVDAKVDEPAIRPSFGFGPAGLQGGFTF